MSRLVAVAALQASRSGTGRAGRELVVTTAGERAEAHVEPWK